jgi:dTMP kinase
MTRDSGRLIVLEGGEGAGKSTVLTALASHLRASGRRVVETREPGGTPLGERIRALILDAGGVDDALAELLLFEAARAHLVATVIRPALEHGDVVLCDRFSASSIAYQAYGRGVPRALVERANALATGGLAPDLTLLLDVPVDIGLARRARGGDANHFDREAVAFHERVRQGFLDLAAASPDEWRIIDAAQSEDAVIAATVDAVSEAIA